ncbi:signal peptidase, partial [Thalassiosira pseudonana CCMP1335]
LVAASIAATVLRIVVVPSESMEPALMPGDVVIVTRSILPPRVGDVVFFNPPSELDEAIANSKGKQFIKRLVAVPGEKVGVFNSSPYTANRTANIKYIRQESIRDLIAVLDKGEYFVAGDNGYRSVDSRVWGPLKRKYIFGTAQYIVFPPAHIG